MSVNFKSQGLTVSIPLALDRTASRPSGASPRPDSLSSVPTESTQLGDSAASASFRAAHQSVRHAGQALQASRGMLDTLDGVQRNLDRMKHLARQATDEELSVGHRASVNYEFVSLKIETSRMLETVKLAKLMGRSDPSSSSSADLSPEAASESSSEQPIRELLLGLDRLGVSSTDQAQQSSEQLQGSLLQLQEQRSYWQTQAQDLEDQLRVSWRQARPTQRPDSLLGLDQAQALALSSKQLVLRSDAQSLAGQANLAPSTVASLLQ